jgi:hypothetical protein
MSPRTKLSLGFVALLFAACRTRHARAQGAEKAFGDGLADAAPLVVPLLFAPSSVGPELAFPKNERSDLRLILGWPLQIPLPFGKVPTLRHRIALAPEVALGARSKAVFRGRFGYRFGYSWFFAGAGLLADRSGVFVSPEIGVRYPPAQEGEFTPGGALYLRTDIDPREKVLRCSAQIGWVLL